MAWKLNGQGVNGRKDLPLLRCRCSKNSSARSCACFLAPGESGTGLKVGSILSNRISLFPFVRPRDHRNKREDPEDAFNLSISSNTWTLSLSLSLSLSLLTIKLIRLSSQNQQSQIYLECLWKNKMKLELLDSIWKLCTVRTHIFAFVYKNVLYSEYIYNRICFAPNSDLTHFGPSVTDWLIYPTESCCTY